MKKTFPCGHRGQGQFCHRCAQETAKAPVLKTKDRPPTEFGEVSLAHLHPDAARAAVRVLEKIKAGRPYHELGGKRLEGCRGTISIPVGRRYRILCRDGADGLLEVTEVISHETYNGRTSKARRR